MKPEIWAELPRVTTKSGWITFQAHPQKSRRGDFQAAVCQLAICILSDDSLKKANPGTSIQSRATVWVEVQLVLWSFQAQPSVRLCL